MNSITGEASSGSQQPATLRPASRTRVARSCLTPLPSAQGWRRRVRECWDTQAGIIWLIDYSTDTQTMTRLELRSASLVLLAAVLTACSSPTAPAASASTQATAAAAANAKAAQELTLYDQMRASQSWDLATSLGEEIVSKYPSSPAAVQVRQTLEDVRAKGTAQRENRRLGRLWAYAASPEAGGTQYTAAVESKEPLKAAAGAKSGERIRLVLRQHPEWGQSVYLLLDNATFDCSKGCATLPVRFDDTPPQRMKATIPPTGEPALFIDDDKAFIAKMQKAKTVSIDATIKGEGAKTFVFETGGYDASKLPGVTKSAAAKGATPKAAPTK